MCLLNFVFSIGPIPDSYMKDYISKTDIDKIENDIKIIQNFIDEINDNFDKIDKEYDSKLSELINEIKNIEKKIRSNASDINTMNGSIDYINNLLISSIINGKNAFDKAFNYKNKAKSLLFKLT